MRNVLKSIYVKLHRYYKQGDKNDLYDAMIDIHGTHEEAQAIVNDLWVSLNLADEAEDYEEYKKIMIKLDFAEKLLGLLPKEIK